MKHREFPAIRLASWEHLPDAAPHQIEGRAQSVVDFEWHREKLRVAARYANTGEGWHFIFVQFLGEEEEGNWVLSHTNFPDHPFAFSRTPRLRLAKRLARNFSPRYSILDMRRQFPFGRLFYVDGGQWGLPAPLRFCVAASGCGQYFPDSRFFGSESFRLPLPHGGALRHVAARDVLEIIHGELARPDSDVRFAIAWQQKTQDEKARMVMRVERGSMSELHRLLTCVLRVEPFPKHQHAHRSWTIIEYYFLIHFSWGDGLTRWTEVPVRMRIWQRLLLEYFQPHSDTALLRRHACVRHWEQMQQLTIETEEPTQHERMEAALFLRDWARDKISPRKLRLLLGHTGTSH